MQNTADLHPLIQYNALFLWLGFFCLLLVVGWYVAVFVITRKKTPKTIATLRPLVPQQLDLSAVKSKYLTLIGELETAIDTDHLTNRTVHQKLSMLVRFFVYEASGMRTDVMTLSDIRRTRLTALSDVVSLYYPSEFKSVATGDNTASLTTARSLVENWQ